MLERAARFARVAQHNRESELCNLHFVSSRSLSRSFLRSLTLRLTWSHEQRSWDNFFTGVHGKNGRARWRRTQFHYWRRHTHTDIDKSILSLRANMPETHIPRVSFVLNHRDFAHLYVSLSHFLACSLPFSSQMFSENNAPRALAV